MKKVLSNKKSAKAVSESLLLKQIPNLIASIGNKNANQSHPEYLKALTKLNKEIMTTAMQIELLKKHKKVLAEKRAALTKNYNDNYFRDWETVPLS